jgi:hypothetical protein
MGDNSSRKKKNKFNTLEILRDASNEGRKTLNRELVRPISADFARQLFGVKRTFSGEIEPGGSIEMNDVFSGKYEEIEQAKKVIRVEKRLLEEERIYVEKQTNELRLQIEAIRGEIVKLAEATPELSQETRVAAFSINSDPSSYELNFLQQLFEIIRDFRQKIEDAGVWLSACNARAAKKNRWGYNYKKYGAKYLLSSEHYLSRSAG